MKIRLLHTSVGIACGLLLNAPVIVAGEASISGGVRIDGSGITAKQVAALDAIVKPSLRKEARKPLTKKEIEAINAESAKLPVTFCYEPGTPMETVSRLEAARALIQPQFNLRGTSWSSSPGTPVHLTVSLVPDGTSIPAAQSIPGDMAGDSVLFATMDAQFANAGGRAAWTLRIMQTFDRWAQLTGTSYEFVSDDGEDLRISPGVDGVRGDIRIGMRRIDGSGTILAFNGFPTEGDMVLDSSETTWANSASGFLRLRNVVAHEHGHGLGLRHVCPINQTNLMEPFITLQFDGPQQDDLRGVHALYGDAREPNGTRGSARFLGTLTTSGQVLPSPSSLPGTISGLATPNARRTSIDRLDDEDWFELRLDGFGIGVATVTVSPIGNTYPSGPQVDGNCSAGSDVDALRQANLAFQIFKLTFSGSLERIASVNARGRGLSESITTLLVPDIFSGPERFFVRVFSSDAPSGPQLYNLSVSGSVVGTFDLDPPEVTVAAQEPITYAFTWTVPEPLNWHDLRELHFLIRDGENIILWVRFNEANNTFSLFDEATDRFGRAEMAGSKKKLHTKLAELDLAQTSVVAIDPTSPTVTLNLALSFKPKAAGHTFDVEVAAADDLGNQDDFAQAGTLTVTPKKSRDKRDKKSKPELIDL